MQPCSTIGCKNLIRKHNVIGYCHSCQYARNHKSRLLCLTVKCKVLTKNVTGYCYICRRMQRTNWYKTFIKHGQFIMAFFKYWRNEFEPDMWSSITRNMRGITPEWGIDYGLVRGTEEYERARLRCINRGHNMVQEAKTKTVHGTSRCQDNEVQVLSDKEPRDSREVEDGG